MSLEGVEPGQTYVVRVKAVNVDGAESPFTKHKIITKPVKFTVRENGKMSSCVHENTWMHTDTYTCVKAQTQAQTSITSTKKHKRA